MLLAISVTFGIAVYTCFTVLKDLSTSPWSLKMSVPCVFTRFYIHVQVNGKQYINKGSALSSRGKNTAKVSNLCLELNARLLDYRKFLLEKHINSVFNFRFLSLYTQIIKKLPAAGC